MRSTTATRRPPWETTMTIEATTPCSPGWRPSTWASSHADQGCDQRAARGGSGARQADHVLPARHDHHLVQTGDGYGPTSGAIGVSTDAQGRRGGVAAALERLPHGLIAAYDGDNRAGGAQICRVHGAQGKTSWSSSTGRTIACGPRSRSRGRSRIGSGACGSTPRRTMVDLSVQKTDG